MKKWDYCYYHCVLKSALTHDDSFEKINELGGEGWELVSAYLYKNIDGDDLHRHIFKRPKAELK